MHDSGGNSSQAACLAYSHRCSVSVGTVGDSGTDEYQGFNNLPALNWVEQLVDRLDFGAQESDPSVRGEPRLNGYARNWARFGMAALDFQWNDLLPPGLDPRVDTIGEIWDQVDGLREQIAAGEIDVAIVQLGANDFNLRWLTGGSFSGPDFDAFSQALVGRIGDIVDSLHEAGDVKVIVALNLFAAPAYGGTQHPFLMTDPNVFTPAAVAHNDALTTAMRARGVPVMDQYGFFGSDRFDSATRMLTVGDYAFSVDSIASPADLLAAGHPMAPGPCHLIGPDTFCSTLDYNLNYIIHDLIHPTTIVQGLMANEFVAAVRKAFGFRVSALSDDEILRNAGISQ